MNKMLKKKKKEFKVVYNLQLSCFMISSTVMNIVTHLFNPQNVTVHEEFKLTQQWHTDWINQLLKIP